MVATVPSKSKPLNRRIFLTLWLAGILGSIALIPYALTLQSANLATIQLPFSLPVVVALQIGQSAIVLAITIAAGLFFANRIGLGTPILRALLQGESERESVSERVKAFVLPAIGWGIVASLAVLGLDAFVFAPALAQQLGQASSPVAAAIQPPVWQGFLASFYGGINEEIYLRLFVLSLIAFIGKFIAHRANGHPTRSILWIATISAAILFGLGHLPATAAILPLTPLVITRAILLNGLAGIGFGYLYFTFGLEAAMLSHFVADIVLHGIAPLFL
ncbi:CPBP family glutamic-type intramembrane protease [Leptolyngbya sp. FACHB-711]|uniref:CPBP family glutamic-type intramembrane protease n=1 Tax=unclassified Leptolyngbya TaxID=2650499 RepID=UPI00168575D5|nr:CPBP family intramembrane metalloprotease [Cyanobacteria bacterium FACHB-502]MBD2024544.1 CPBP family intramembrane metalloprotease [Leptolyngbya sp. FACHB-711]